MRLNINNRVVNKSGSAGTVDMVDPHMVRVQFDHGGKPGWFDRENDNRLTLADS